MFLEKLYNLELEKEALKDEACQLDEANELVEKQKELQKIK